MYRYFFRSDIRENYYNCSIRSYEEWKKLGEPNVPIGLVYMMLGFFYFITYFPFMIVFVKSGLLKHSCYKIMFFLGIVDMIQIPIGMYVGYLSIVGTVFCLAPDFLYFFGSVANGVWTMGSATCMLLALNRCVDIVDHNLAVSLFQGRKTLLWLLAPALYGIGFCLFFPAIIFSPAVDAFMYDPFFGMPERHGSIDVYPSAFLSGYNVFVVVWLAAMYGGLCIKLSLQARSSTAFRMSRLQRQTFATALLICSGTFVAALVYCFLQFLTVPAWVAFVGQVGWQTSHGMVGITYLLMNRTMRNEAIRIFCGRQHHNIITTATSKVGTESASFTL